MRRYTGKIATALVLLAASLAAAAALPPQYAGTPTQKDYPVADVLVLSETRAFTLLPDGRTERSVRLVEKVLNYEGLDAAGDPKVAFDSKRQDLKITRSRTFTPEGVAVDTKANGFTEMTPFALERSPEYTDIRQMVITHVGLDVNAVIETEYSITDKRPWMRHLEGVEVLRNSDPALVREVVVAVPSGTALKWAVLNGQGEPSVKRDGGNDVYTWTWKDLPLARVAETSAAEQAYLPTLIFTTCPDWSKQNAQVGALVERAVAATSPELEKKVTALLKDAKGDFERITKIHEYVASAIKTVDWPLADFDYAPRPSGKIFDSGYGHSLDKGVLLAAMLKGAGFDATVGVSGPNLPKGGDVACLQRMTSTLVRVETGKSYILLDPAAKLSEKSLRDYAGEAVLPLRAGFDATHAVTAYDAANALAISLEAKVADDLSLEGQGTLNLDGSYSPFYQVQGSEDSLKEALGALLGSIFPGAELASSSVIRMEPAHASFKVAFKAKAPKASGPVKVLKTGLPDASLLTKVPGLHRSERDVPVVLPWTGTESVTLKLTLPEKLQPRVLPKALKVENAAGKVSQESSLKEGTLTIDLEVALPQRVVAASDYGSIKALCTAPATEGARIVAF